MWIAGGTGLEEISDRDPGMPISVSPAESLLLREMTHRIRNELTSTIGYVSCLAARSKSCDVKLALAEVTEHLHDHARLYQALQVPVENCLINATAYLRALCQTIYRARLENNQIELVLVEHPIRLYSSQCWRLGMIVNELITNSCRHAFGHNGGTIRIELKRCGDFAQCQVTDDGSSSNIVRSGHGLDIVRQLADALGGEIDLRLGLDGAVAVVSFPLSTELRDGLATTRGS